MRPTTFRRVRRRLSYANVMATLAFFFALTGGSMAATKYLSASDQITQGDLAGSTYGNPVVATGKVTTGKIADGAITSVKFDSAATAPNATKLAGHALTDFPLIVARGTFTVNVTADPDSCSTTLTSAPVGVQASDTVIANPTSFPALPVEVRLQRNPPDVGGADFLVDFCNQGSSTAGADETFQYIVLR